MSKAASQSYLTKLGRPTKRTAAKRSGLLEMVRLTGGSIVRACEMMDVTPEFMRKWRAEDADFANEVARARIEGNEMLEAELIRRGSEGVLEPVIHDGKLCFHDVLDADGNVIDRRQIFIRRYSDRCLEILARMRGMLVDKPQPVSITMTLADMVAASFKPRAVEAPTIEANACATDADAAR